MAEALPEYPDSDFSDEDLSSLDISFNKAADHIRKITNTLDNNKLLELYGLYKQGLEGQCNVPRPGWLDGRGRRKWDAWKALEDLSQADAKKKYIELVQKYDPEWTNLELSEKEMWVSVSTHQYSPEPELTVTELSLIDAAREDCAQRVAELLSKHPNLKDERDDDGLTALHWAADRDATKALVAAIVGGCSVNAVDDTGQTPLHYAASCGHVKSTQILLDSGALPTIKDEDGFLPLDLASEEDVRKILLSANSSHK